MLVVFGCEEFDPGDVDVFPSEFHTLPSILKFHNSDWNTVEKPQNTQITFKYIGELQDIPESDWKDVGVRFWIADVDWDNQADNNTQQDFFAVVNGQEGRIPRPVGKLLTTGGELIPEYFCRLPYGTTEIGIVYQAPEISGKFRIIGELWFDGVRLASKNSEAFVLIPNLQEIPRKEFREVYDPWASQYTSRQLWHIVGMTDFHKKNNNLQNDAHSWLELLAESYITKTREYESNRWLILRLNDMSLPWGGMFWIGYKSGSDLTMERVDPYGMPYMIRYRANYDNRIYAIPHETHREGRSVDLDIYAAISENDPERDYSKLINPTQLRDSAQEANYHVYTHDSHYHLTCLRGRIYWQ